MSFFEEELILPEAKPPPTLIPQCSSCGLYKNCISPKMPIYGNGDKKIFILGEAPGENEDRKNKPFIGKAGQRLRNTLRKLEVDPKKDCWIYNSLICRTPKNRTPTSKEVEYCRPNVIKQIEKLKPNVIILLGNIAIKSVLGWLFSSDPGGVTKWAGYQIPSIKPNCWICPTYHPSFLERSNSSVLDLYFTNHLKKAANLGSKPWEKLPKYKEMVEIIINEEDAIKRIDEVHKLGKPFAFDYETTCLKPDGPEAEIWSCSISNGLITAAFPWSRKVKKRMREILADKKIGKIGQNAKFEHRWTLAKLDVEVKGWIHDDMLMAHVLDNRPGVTGIEFNAYVELGLPPWDQKVSKYLSSSGGSKRNNIHKCPLPELLLYNGLDSLAEYLVYKNQKERIESWQ